MLEGRVLTLDVDVETPFAEVTIELSTNASTQSSAAPVRLRSRITRAAADDLELAEGVSVFALIKSVILDV